MMEAMIELENVTKDYGAGRGVFGLNLRVAPGEVVGIVGINGSGKTTTLRQAMGFLKPTHGKITLDGKDAWQESAAIKKEVGYVPGEIAFPDSKSGATFLKTQEKLLHLHNSARANTYLQAFKLDATANLKRMSKGMKQKTALVAALMSDSPILLLDEPTTGLDPVMRDVFIQSILAEKKRGKTILMSSHMFNELEPTCDRIVFLRAGHIVEILTKQKMAEIRNQNQLRLDFATAADCATFLHANPRAQQVGTTTTVTMSLAPKELRQLLPSLTNYSLDNFSLTEGSLDDYFTTHVNLEEK